MRRLIVMALLFALGSPLLSACGVSNTDRLTATTWYLVAGAEGNPSWQWTVPKDLQTNYTIRFEGDGTFSSRADCNQLAGSWEASGSDRVTVKPGPMTMAFCGEMSFDILYAGTLGQVRNWNVASTGLSLTLADGGRLDYTSVAPPTPSATAEETPETPAAVTPSATPTPVPTVTTTVTVSPSATSTARPSTTAPRPPSSTPPATPTSIPTPPPTPPQTPTATPPPPSGPRLTSRGWQLTDFSLNVPAFQGTVPADLQPRYTMQFRADGTFTAQADCNTVNGTYAPSDPSGSTGSLSVVPGPTTLAACGEGSYGDLYITAIANAAGFAIDGEILTISLVDSGTLTYR